MSTQLLTEEEVAQFAQSVPNWKVEKVPKGAICLEWKGRNFRETFALMTEIAELAEQLNHHPEWCNVYSRLTIRLTTHDVGGLSMLDFTMAEQIDALIARREKAS
jgi:4a-hydroxytetrahydrobiopterin dehydratase